MREDWGTRLAVRWARTWMRCASLSTVGRLAMRIAAWAPLPYLDYYGDHGLAHISAFGYVGGSVRVHHEALRLGRHIFINDHVRIIGDKGGGPVTLGDYVSLGFGCQLHTGQNGSIEVGRFTSIENSCELFAFLSAIRIGAHVMIASNCHFFSYNHGTRPGVVMQRQPLSTKGDIVIEDDVWIGTGAIILSGVKIESGAVVGAGAVVTRDVPPRTIVAGNPAGVVKHRDEQEDDLFVEDPSSAVMMRSFDGIITSWNQGASRLYGWAPEEVLTRQSHSLLSTIFPEPLQRIEEELRRTGRWEGMLVHIRRDGIRVIVRSRWLLKQNDTNGGSTVIETNRLVS